MPKMLLQNCDSYFITKCGRSLLQNGKVILLHPPSNGEGLRDIQYIMSMVLDTRFHIWFIMTVYYKMPKMLLQNAIARSSLQNVTGFL